MTHTGPTDGQPARPVRVAFPEALFSPLAVKKAAYRLGDRCYVELESRNGDTVVTLRPKRLLENVEALAGELRNQALDYDLRERIAAETEPVRNLLLAQAFSPLNLIEPQADTGTFDSDPLGTRRSGVTGHPFTPDGVPEALEQAE